MSLIPIYKNAFQGAEDKNENLRFTLALLYIFSLPFNLFYSSIIFITLAVVTLMGLKKSHFSRIPRQFWMFQGVFYFGVVGYFYSLHRSDAGFLLERQLSILLVPVILPLSFTLNERRVKAMLFTLALSCTLVMVYLFSNMLLLAKSMNLSYVKVIFSGVFFNHRFSQPLGIHAGYLSLYVGMSALYLVWLLHNVLTVSSRFLLALMLPVLFMGLFFLASRNVLITVFIIMLFVYPFFRGRHKLRYISISVVSVLVCFVVVKSVPYLNQRFSIQFISDIRPLSNGGFVSYSATEPRIERWKCALDLINQSPLFGYGTGDEIKMLKVKYMEKDLFVSYLEEFNAHNQYLSYCIKNGLIGLLLFLLLFFYYLQLAVKTRSFSYLSFLMLLLMGFYTENILDANKGIVFFAFFNTMFGYQAIAKLNSNTT